MPDTEFQLRAKRCPWRVDEWCNGFIQKCSSVNCAIWHFIIAERNKG